MGLASLAFDPRAFGAAPPPSGFEVPAKAKNCICFFMEGGPSQFDLFSYKPKLKELDGQRPPESLLSGQRFAFIDKSSAVLRASPRTFSQHGQGGMWFSDLLPNLAKKADQIAMLGAVHTSQFNHHPAQLVVQTGGSLPGRPSLGAWLLYGLGTANPQLPGHIVLNSSGFISGGESLWGSGFVSASHGGVLLQTTGAPVHNLARAPGISAGLESEAVAAVARLNALGSAAKFDRSVSDRTESYELALAMESTMPEVMDLAGESSATLQRYGLGRSDPKISISSDRRPPFGCFDLFARHALMARRLVERGVRFVNVFAGSWDMHDNLDTEMPFYAGLVDQPIAALIDDLAERGLLEETLVLFVTEFGRTPLGQGNGTGAGRDHHPSAFNMFLAGGGVKGGMTFGETDEIGWEAASGSVSVADVHATVLRLLGVDHEKLTVRFAGLDQRLTPVTESARVIGEILS